MTRTHIRPVRSDEDHAWALSRIGELMDAEPGTQEMDELEVLAQLVEIYEAKRWPISLPSPVAAIKFRMEQSGLTRRDLQPFIGSSGKVSEVLSGKLPLTLKMIRSLHLHLGIPADLLLGKPEGRLDGDGLAENAVKYPFKEMEELGWFAEFGPTKGRSEEAILWLSARAGVDAGQLTAFCPRNDGGRLNSKIDPFALQAWRLQALIQAKEMPVYGTYDPAQADAALLRQVAMLSVLPEGPKRAQELLAHLGIRLIILPRLKRTYLDGAALLMPDGSPLVALTLRHDRLDRFWHDLLHELAHVKNDLMGSSDLFCDDFSIPPADSEIEQRADREAAEALVPPGILPMEREALESLSLQELQAIARKARVHPVVVAGLIRHKTGNWRKFSRLAEGHGVRSSFFSQAA